METTTNDTNIIRKYDFFPCRLCSTNVIAGINVAGALVRLNGIHFYSYNLYLVMKAVLCQSFSSISICQ